VAFGLELLEAGENDVFSLGCVAPALKLDPLAWLKVFVVLEEVLDLSAGELGQIIQILNV
jgi:hypothetical protein